MLPDYTRGGFYDPGSSYRGVATPWQFGAGQQGLDYQQLGTQDDQSAYYAKLSQLGLGGMGSRAQQAQNLLPMFRRGYGAARLTKNANLYFPEYLDQARIGDIINQQSFAQQGVDAGQYQGRYRWSMRPGG
jgi:hypothetical protein